MPSSPEQPHCSQTNIAAIPVRIQLEFRAAGNTPCAVRSLLGTGPVYRVPRTGKECRALLSTSGSPARVSGSSLRLRRRVAGRPRGKGGKLDRQEVLVA